MFKWKFMKHKICVTDTYLFQYYRVLQKEFVKAKFKTL